MHSRRPRLLLERALPRRGFVTTGRPHVVSDEERAGEEEIVLVLAREAVSWSVLFGYQLADSVEYVERANRLMENLERLRSDPR